MTLSKVFRRSRKATSFKLLVAAVLCSSIFAATSAYAACGKMSVSSRGGYVEAGSSEVLYSHNVSCLGYQYFKLENLTGNRPRQSFLLEYQYRDGGVWRTVSSANGYGVSASVHFSPAEKGSYRLLITNQSGSTIRSYSLTGDVTSHDLGF